ncbi:unnamed protein product [Prorocentrum cordatum]|uniref:Sulfotransferase n=1 Tax=Prorocentrum cordatum TaxID=2364126 RepID=A0ABN9U139_9DINO|nr:unnamed protein product [Polarella glacialis]
MALVAFAPRFVGLPPHLSPTCCWPGSRRLRVAVVRNPFRRLASFFANVWLPNRGPGRSLGTWAAFGPWVVQLWRWRSERQRRCRLGGTGAPGSDARVLPGVPPAAEFLNAWFWHHLRPQVEAIRSPQLLPEAELCESLGGANGSRAGAAPGAPLHLLRVEDLGADLGRLERTLCTEFAHCARLPPFPRTNEAGASAPAAPPAAALWGAAAVRHAVDLYRADFDGLGYGREPSEARPLPSAPSVLRL